MMGDTEKCEEKDSSVDRALDILKRTDDNIMNYSLTRHEAKQNFPDLAQLYDMKIFLIFFFHKETNMLWSN